MEGPVRWKQKAQLEYATDVREFKDLDFAIPEVANVFDDFLYY